MPPTVKEEESSTENTPPAKSNSNTQSQSSTHDNALSRTKSLGQGYKHNNFNTSLSRKISDTPKVNSFDESDLDLAASSGLGPALQKIRSVPNYSSSPPVSSHAPSKKSWFSRFKKHDNPAPEVSNTTAGPTSHLHGFFKRNSSTGQQSTPPSSGRNSPKITSKPAKASNPTTSPPLAPNKTTTPSTKIPIVDLNPFNSSAAANFGLPLKPTLSNENVQGNLTTTSHDHNGLSAQIETQKQPLNSKSKNGTSEAATTSNKTAAENTLSPSHSSSSAVSSVSSNGSSTSTISSSSSSSPGSKPNTDSTHILNSVPLIRVTFSADTFDRDPPQQIPARKPKQGTVKVDEETGKIVRPHHSLDATSSSGYSHAAKIATTAAYNSAVLVANCVRADAKRSNRLSSLGNKLTRTATNTLTSQRSPQDDDTEDESSSKTNESFSGIDIDRPITKASGFPPTANTGTETTSKDGEEKKANPTLAEVYTRCCHLREILPINATLKQLEGKTAPLPSLQLMNPRPTMIEVLAFADFLSVASISCLILDNVDMSEEMFKQIILSLINAESLMKLSLRNVNLTPTNWKVLCSFLAHNKWITKLDLSLKFPEPGKKRTKYKQSEYFGRENLDWYLLKEAIVLRKIGLEELNINSCYIPHDQFRSLILDGCAVGGTKRLGVSCNDLEKVDIDVINEWISTEGNTCEGLDLSGNPVISVCPELINNLYHAGEILYLSLNSCNLSLPDSFSKILSENAPQSKLKFLDLSFNPKLFPKISPALFGSLPSMSNLIRLYLDNNNLCSQDIFLLADAIPKCKHLVHLSLTGNTDINAAAAETLAVAVKLSDTVTMVNIDTDILPPSIARRLNHYCMQNMEQLVNDIKPTLDKNGYNFEGEEEIVDESNELINAVNYVVDDTKDSVKTQAEADKAALTADGLAKRAIRVREKVQTKLKELAKAHPVRDMPSDVRDKVIRFWYLDKTLEEVVNKYERTKAAVTAKIHHENNPGLILSASGISSKMVPKHVHEAHHVAPTHLKTELNSHKLSCNENDSTLSISQGGSQGHNLGEIPSPYSFAVSSNIGSNTDLPFDSMNHKDSTASTESTPVYGNGKAKPETPSLYRECAPLDEAEEAAMNKKFEEMAEHIGEPGYDFGQDDYGVCVMPKKRSINTKSIKTQEREEGELHKLGNMFKLRQHGGEELLTGEKEREFDDDDDDDDQDTLDGNDDFKPAVEEEEPITGDGHTRHAHDLNKIPGKMITAAVEGKSGEELRNIWLKEVAQSNNNFEEFYSKIKTMTPEKFDEYFKEIVEDVKSDKTGQQEKKE